jgi:hypothetical protein
MPGQSVSYTFRANDPGVFMNHCGTNRSCTSRTGCGAIVVEPRPAPEGGQELRARRGEWYLVNRLDEPAIFDMAKAHARQPGG